MKNVISYLILLFTIACHATESSNSDGGNYSERTIEITKSTPEIQYPDRNTIEIKEGKGGAKLLIGDTKSQTLKILGVPSTKYNLEKTQCNYLKLHWTDLKYGGDGIYAFFKDDKIIQLKFSSSLYATHDGIGLKSTPEKVREVYKQSKKSHQLQEFILENSGQEYNGGEDLIFWVDQNQGIAFQFYFDREQNRRLLWSIEVFDPKVQFLPDACVLHPQNFLKRGQVLPE